MMSFLISILLLMASPSGMSDDPDAEIRIERSAMNLLASRYPDAAHRLRVRVIRRSGSIEPNTSLRLSLSGVGVIPKAHVQVQIEQPLKGEQWEKVGKATLYISHFDSVAITSRSFSPDEALSRSDLQFAWIETTRFRGEPLNAEQLTILETQGPLFSKKFLRPDRALRVNDVRPAYAVETGQAVTMDYQRNRIALTLRTKARMPGFAGETVKLFSSVTNKTYRARITAPGRAEWIETLD